MTSICRRFAHNTVLMTTDELGFICIESETQLGIRAKSMQ